MDITKLQRIVVDALEDVKAQDIKIFNTTHLTSLFDRVIIASATAKPAHSLQAFRTKLAKQAALSSPPKARKPENGCWWILVTLLCTSCSPPSASITTSKKSGVARRFA
jgi:ribosome-associated protein